jgi:hypothetical protein
MRHRLAAAVALVLASSAQAQQYEFDARSKFEREVLKEAGSRLRPPRSSPP